MADRKTNETNRARKVQIFKWLAKKHRCKIRLVRDFIVDSSKKKSEFVKIVLDREDGISFTLMTNKKPSSSGIRPKLTVVEVPAPSWDVSYADVLDWVLETMEKNESDCWLVDVWSNRYIGLFLKKGTALEELDIEFDMSWRDVFSKRA